MAVRITFGTDGWRAVMAREFTFDNVRLATQGIARYLLDQGHTTIVLTGSGYTGGLYQAGTGYDMATGLGTPKAPALVEALCAAKPASPGATYTPVTPARVLDTRSAVGVPTTSPLGSGGTLSLQLAGSPPPTTPTTALSACATTSPWQPPAHHCHAQ